MNERDVEIREGTLRRPDADEMKVEIVDSGENFNLEKGSVPNHDRVEIVYISPKS